MKVFGFWFLIFFGSTIGYLQEGYEEIKITKFGHSIGGNLAEPYSESDEGFLEVSQHFITQPLDHLNPNKSWEQRYWNNSNFYEPNGPIFFVIGGNSKVNEKWITNPNVTYLQWAKKFKAMVFILEHRFYGESLPTENLSVESLQYLSSKQALGDIVNFISAVKDEYQNSKWITFGGSYGGTLAVWFRKKYPEAVVGAVASSAPVHLKTNFFEYLQVVQRSLYDYDIKCAQNVAHGFADIFSSLYNSDTTAALNTVFKLSNTLAYTNDSFQKDSQVFFSSIIAVFQTAVQYNGINANLPFDDGLGIENVCKIMMQDLNYKENLQKVYSFINQNDIIDSDYLKNVELLSNSSFDGIYSEMRTWLWQSCTEFGYFQSTDLGRNIFGSTVSIDFYIDLCTDVFGFTRTVIDASIDLTKQFYGKLTNYNVTNVALLYGSQDPWHALGFFDITNIHGITSFFINGTSTCADMYPSSESDPPELILARDNVAKLINDWIH